MNKSLEHPLALLLGPDWWWLYEPRRDLVVIVSQRGTHTAIPPDELGEPHPWEAVARALAAARPGRWRVVLDGDGAYLVRW